MFGSRLPLERKSLFFFKSEAGKLTVDLKLFGKCMVYYKIYPRQLG